MAEKEKFVKARQRLRFLIPVLETTLSKSSRESVLK